MTFNKKDILLWLTLLVFVMPMKAQTEIEIEENEETTENTDSIVIDSIGATHVFLPWPQSLRAEIDAALKSQMFQTSQVGLLVYDLDGDSVIYAHNERQLMRPASTMKVITAVAAIDKLGGSYRFKTELYYTGQINNQTLVGNLYCVGGMDPRFNTDDMNAFVESLQKMGVDTIRGTMYADKSMKNSDLLGEGWCWDDDNPVLSPLVYGRKDVFMEKFVHHLRDKGIVVEALTSTGRKPQEAMLLCSRFHTMDQILMKMMKDSDNLYAESMFYQLAASSGNQPATARDAAAIIKTLIKKVGLKPSDYRIADGSGLSLYNYVSAELLVRFLRYAEQNSNIRLHLRPSLPIAGFDGTLKSRMKNAFAQENVKAKTGTLTGLISLAGYCTASNGNRLCFAIINQGVMGAKTARNFQDKICTILTKP